ncbi:hypothetical protein RA19_23200 [Leisingera sp. ANG-M1]|uniref:hypothetical protein n=1 Tax=Leisingera sp. ANG-M1 TaxID=1577895 RepID=UPI00057CD7EF|nr:hypothetical protein [Leisingera sp. ANG-M1]KIC07687.1 hypothetical protein RA19_23200 [Leisingera sp. ANG-M1]
MLLTKPLAPQKTETGYSVEIRFLDAAPPNQLRGLNEQSYRQHAIAALEEILDLVSREDGDVIPWQDVFRIRDFEIEWNRANPYLYTTAIEFTLHDLENSSATIEMRITSQDGKVEVARALCGLAILSGDISIAGNAYGANRLLGYFSDPETTPQ